MRTPVPAVLDCSIEARRLQVSQLRAQGLTGEQIASRLSIKPHIVYSDISAIKAQWMAAARENRQTWVSVELERLDFVEREAITEWFRSRQPAREIREENDSGAAGGTPRTKTTRSRRGRIGDSRLLSVVLKCHERRAALLGLDAPPASAADLDRDLAEPTIIEVTTREAARLVMESSDGKLLVRVTDEQQSIAAGLTLLEPQQPEHDQAQQDQPEQVPVSLRQRRRQSRTTPLQS